VPFQLARADGWRMRDQGDHVVFIPPIAPVGMDVYMTGHYSTVQTKERTKLYQRAREELALAFAEPFNPKIKKRDLRATKVAGEPALFWKTRAPGRPEITWRQWAVVLDGWGFVIVSAIEDKNETRVLPDVERMVASFGLAPEANELLQPVTVGAGPAPGETPPAADSSRPRGYAGPRGPRSMWTTSPASVEPAP
jgi:hypothetical protein